jgi:hypothetical protein
VFSVKKGAVVVAKGQQHGAPKHTAYTEIFIPRLSSGSTTTYWRAAQSHFRHLLPDLSSLYHVVFKRIDTIES